MNFPGLITLWIASGLAMAFAAWRLVSHRPVKQPARLQKRR
jgi:hypothetical protein